MVRHLLRGVLLLTVIGWAGLNAYAGVVYVSTNGNNAGGTNWTTAYTTLSNALLNVLNSDTVYVAGQTFNVTTQVNLSAKTGVSLVGGYAATNDLALPGSNNPSLWPTVLMGSGGNLRIFYASGLTNCVLRNLTFQKGFYNTVERGMGIYATLCSGLTIDSCMIVSNILQSTGSSLGAGIFINSGTVLLTNCLIATNSVIGVPNAYGYGGGVVVNAGTTTITHCQIIGNYAAGANYYDGYGGGIYVNAAATAIIRQSVISRNTAAVNAAVGGGIANYGRLILENCVVDHNNNTADTSDGIYAGGTASILNCTIADNDGKVGVLCAGSVVISNSIIWGHADDLKSFPSDGLIPPTLSNVFYSCVYNGDNNGRQGCISINPLFVNTNYYHLQSKQGYYSNAYFSGGTWASSLSNSPVIDAGHPASDYAGEPAPNGSRVNQGAYGNTPVASKTDIVTVFTPPGVTNRGATVVGHRTARLNAQITTTGGQTPQVWFHYWIVGNTSTTVVWAGLQDGVIAQEVGGLTPGNAYAFYALASNSMGSVTSAVKFFSTHAAPSSLYVSTNGNNTAGTNWMTSFTNLQEALNIIENGDTVYLAGHSFEAAPPFQQFSLWTWQGDTGVSVLGGYAATNDGVLPGVRDSAQWPTTFKRASGSSRILYLANLTNCSLRDVTIRDGYLNAVQAMNGMGIYMTGCSGFTLDACVVTNNVAYGSIILGGGLFVNSGSLLVTNCLFTKNIAGANGNSKGLGGGVYINSGSTTLVLCRVEKNQATHANNPVVPYPSGGGLYVGSAATGVVIQTVVSENAISVYSIGAYGGGGICSYGSLLLQNCLVDHNQDAGNQSDGIYANNSLSIINCTVADNSGVGLKVAGGSAFLEDSIFWNNTDDLTGVMAVAYCDLQTADPFWTNGVNGCISIDPLFVDTHFYHLQSRRGQYLGGYFTGGSWSYGLSNSPCIDSGNPFNPFGLEPTPNGRRVNRGAYGNSPVASLDYLLRGGVVKIY